MLDQQKCHGSGGRKFSKDSREDLYLGRSSRNSSTDSQLAMDDSSRRTSMVFTIDEKDLYGQWNFEPTLSGIKEPDSATIDEKPQEWRSGYLLKLFYLVGAAGAAITTYLVYRAYFRPDAVDFEE